MTNDTLTATRVSVHGLAEHVLAGTERRITGSIRLFVRDGALSTPDLPGTITRLELRDGNVLRHPDGLTVPLRGTLGELADRLGVEFGMPDPPYRPASGCGPDHVVTVDPSALEVITDAWRIGDDALRRFDAQTPVVWPEHLDVGIAVHAVNYGVSPGDDYSTVPYAYVGPHTPRSGSFWNAPFGAARPLTDLGGADGVLDFFRQGQAAAA